MLPVNKLEVDMGKSGSQRVKECREKNSDKARMELWLPVVVKAQFEALHEIFRLTKPELFTRMVQAGLPDREQTTDTTTICSTGHLDKLKWLADRYTVTPSKMMEQLIDSKVEEQQAIDRRNISHAPIRDAEKRKIKPSDMAELLLKLFKGDRLTAMHEYYAVLQQDNDGWIFEPTRKKGDPLAVRYHMVIEGMRRKEQKAKKKASSP